MTISDQILAEIGRRPGRVIRIKALRLKLRLTDKATFCAALDELIRVEALSLKVIRNAGYVRLVSKPSAVAA